MRVIAVYPGRFHPFHKGHADSFKQLASAFGLKNTFLAISQKQEPPRSPFSAIDRAKMAMSLGIPKENIIVVKNTYSGKEYMQRFQSMGVDVNDTALVFGVSQKDMGTDPRFTFNDKQDGTPSYMQPVSKGIESPMTKHAYVMTTNVKQFPIAGMAMTDASQIRSAYAKGDNNLKANILTDLYGKNAKYIKPIFDQNLSIMESLYQKLVLLKQRITESKQTVMENRFVVTHHNSLSDETLTILVKADDEYDAKDKVSYSLGRGSNIVDVRPARGDEPTDQEYKAYKDPRTGLSRAGIYDREQGVDEAANAAQQAAIAINMKKHHKKPKDVSEAFDNPYAFNWQRGDHGDYDILVKLPDGSPLNISFNHENDGVWQVAFDRGMSQEITGEGDAQRIFATVLYSIKQFIGKEHPEKLYFSASKDVEPGQNSESRAKLYSRMVQRYANSWGYDIVVDDFGRDSVTYILNKKQEVDESMDPVYTVIANGEEFPCNSESHAENKARKLLSYGKADIVYVAKDGQKIYSWKMGEPKQPMTDIEEHIEKVGSQYRLVSKHGHKNLGTYPTKAGAEKRERQVQYFKHVKEDYLDE